MEKLMKLEEAANILNVNVKHLRAAARTGELETIVFRGMTKPRYVTEESLSKWLKAQTG